MPVSREFGSVRVRLRLPVQHGRAEVVRHCLFDALEDANASLSNKYAVLNFLLHTHRWYLGATLVYRTYRFTEHFSYNLPR